MDVSKSWTLPGFNNDRNWSVDGRMNLDFIESFVFSENFALSIAYFVHRIRRVLCFILFHFESDSESFILWFINKIFRSWYFILKSNNVRIYDINAFSLFFLLFLDKSYLINIIFQTFYIKYKVFIGEGGMWF